MNALWWTIISFNLYSPFLVASLVYPNLNILFFNLTTFFLFHIGSPWNSLAFKSFWYAIIFVWFMYRGVSRATIYGEILTLQDVSLNLSLNFKAQIRIESIRIKVWILTVVRNERIIYDEAVYTWCDLCNFLQGSVVIYSAIHVNLDACLTFFSREITF